VTGTIDRTGCFLGLRGVQTDETQHNGARGITVELASIDTSPPSTTATRPATTPPGQTSLPNDAPPATTTQTTGEASRDPVVKKMNEDEKQKVDTKGK
jgi:hypothetical protein